MTVTASPTAALPRDAGEPRKKSLWRRAGRVSAWAVCVLVVVLGAAFFAPRLPITPVQDALGVIALFVPWLTGFLMVCALGAAATAVMAWRSGRRALFGAGVLAALLAVLMVVVPWAVAARTAEVSWSEYFASPAAATPTSTETYATVDGQDLKVDVYRPRALAASKPALLYVHGGSWNSGTRADSAPWLRWMADQGIAVFSIDYRLAPPPRWQDAVGDVKCALGWIRGKAGEYGIAPSNVSIAGDSAGGQLSMIAAYTVDDAQFPPSCQVPQAPVKSVMGWYAPTDLPRLLNENGLPGVAATVASDYLGGGIDSHRDRYEASSPVTHARHALPPTLLVQGDRDHMIPATQAADLAAKLDAAGVPATAVTIPWAEHNFTGQWGTWGSQILRPHVQRFLQEHAIKG
ncbi:alpha/beta hydrolase [Nonomuraea sp. NPDC026600]|uniref:alpha/beta hydrolase n=1 Tax=Nonomuraea sp. NPDC026600 TaxID=3155363 RepID=UPI0033C511ED